MTTVYGCIKYLPDVPQYLLDAVARLNAGVLALDADDYPSEADPDGMLVLDREIYEDLCVYFTEEEITAAEERACNDRD
jgi:hypothetical protein